MLLRNPCSRLAQTGLVSPMIAQLDALIDEAPEAAEPGHGPGAIPPGRRHGAVQVGASLVPDVSASGVFNEAKQSYNYYMPRPTVPQG